MRSIPVAFILALMSFTASPASAQSQPSFESLSERLQVGSRLRVEDREGKRTMGRLARLTAEEITLDTGSGERRFRVDAVAEVAERRSYSRRGALVGFGIGAALGIYDSCCSAHPDRDAFVLTGLLGAGAGAVTGALIPRMQTVYRRGGGPTSFTIAPELSGRRVAAVAAVRW